MKVWLLPLQTVDFGEQWNEVESVYLRFLQLFFENAWNRIILILLWVGRLLKQFNKVFLSGNP